MNKSQIEPWKVLSESDKLKPSNLKDCDFKEGYSRKINNDQILYYTRHKTVLPEPFGLSNEDISHFSVLLGKQRTRPSLIQKLLYGFLFEDHFLYMGANIELMMVREFYNKEESIKDGKEKDMKNFQSSLLKPLTGLKNYLKLFENIPTKYDYYEKELETLNNYLNLENKLREGQASFEEINSLYVQENDGLRTLAAVGSLES